MVLKTQNKKQKTKSKKSSKKIHTMLNTDFCTLTLKSKHFFVMHPHIKYALKFWLSYQYVVTAECVIQMCKLSVSLSWL